jgi:3-isopropylmalate/(R)-2-methylmalate dehydratase small subunit
MERFTLLRGIAAPLNFDNIDTDKILPGRYLKTVKRTGLGIHLFEPLRYDRYGHETPDFILNQLPYQHAKFLIAGENFGCGSSREHAPWALLDFGIRCIIAPSFADIFFANCFKNGLLCIALQREACDRLISVLSHSNGEITVDLASQLIAISGDAQIPFEVDPFHRRCLLDGLDEIALTLQRVAAIEAYEARVNSEQRWRPHID